MPKEWDNIGYGNDEGVKRLAYDKTAVVLWGAVQHLIGEKDEILDIIKTMNKDMAMMKGEIVKLKNTM